MYNTILDDLKENQVHIWYLRPSDFQPDEAIRRYHYLLTDQEKQQHNRFHFEKDRHQYLLTRYLIRSVLSIYFPETAPDAWRFSANKFGRPHLDTPVTPTSFNFNLSHTHNLIVCAATMAGTVGVDVEMEREDTQLVSLSDRFYAPKEIQFINTLSKNEQITFFYRLWTLKEAFIKAEGKGLSIELDKFYFTFDNRRIIFSHFLLNIDCKNYCFWQSRFRSGDDDTGCELGLALNIDSTTNIAPEVKLIPFNRPLYYAKDFAFSYCSR